MGGCKSYPKLFQFITLKKEPINVHENSFKMFKPIRVKCGPIKNEFAIISTTHVQ